MLKISLETSSKIPKSASMVLTLPTNVVLDPSNVVMLINGSETTPTVNAIAKQLTLRSMPTGGLTAFTIEILDGVLNPSTGPYSFDYLQIEFKDSSGFSISKLTSQVPLISVECNANCASCSGTLSTCNSCTYDSTLDKSFFLINQTCQEECGSGYFEDASGYICSPCAEGCLECSTSATACTLCNPL
jgi:hypothetical protein